MTSSENNEDQMESNETETSSQETHAIPAGELRPLGIAVLDPS